MLDIFSTRRQNNKLMVEITCYSCIPTQHNFLKEDVSYYPIITSMSLKLGFQRHPAHLNRKLLMAVLIRMNHAYILIRGVNLNITCWISHFQFYKLSSSLWNWKNFQNLIFSNVYYYNIFIVLSVLMVNARQSECPF